MTPFERDVLDEFAAIRKEIVDLRKTIALIDEVDQIINLKNTIRHIDESNETQLKRYNKLTEFLRDCKRIKSKPLQDLIKRSGL